MVRSDSFIKKHLKSGVLAMAFCLCLSGCAPQTIRKEVSYWPSAAPVDHSSAVQIRTFEVIPKQDQMLQASSEEIQHLRDSYQAALNANVTDSLVLEIRLTPYFQQKLSWWWYLCVPIVGPLVWPFQPRSGEIGVISDILVFQHEQLIHQIHFQESESFQFRYYGSLKKAELQKQADMIQQKAIQRLIQFLRGNQ